MKKPYFMLWSLKIVGVIAIMICTRGLEAAPGVIEQAVKNYNEGHFENAAQGFEQSLTEGNYNAGILFDLGNAYYRIGKKDQALAAYLGAYRLDPWDRDLNANISLVVDQVSQGLTPIYGHGSVMQVVGKLVMSISSSLLFALASVSLSLVLLINFFIVIKAKSIPNLNPLRIGGFVFSIVFMGMLFMREYYLSPCGVVVSNDDFAYSGPAENNVQLFGIFSGMPVAKLSQDGEWFQIGVSDGRKRLGKGPTSKIFLRPK